MAQRRDGANQRRERPPEQRLIGKLQAERLAHLTDLRVEEIVDSTIAKLSDQLRWRIDPELLFFRRVCGRVVKKDPLTGIEYPVPGATVHVEDTDCSFLWFYPEGWIWGWFFPLFCRREEIATAVTDSCGRFCVLIPRWDIDWILRWRRERICLPDILVKATFRDLLEELPPIFQERLPFRPPRPEPDPPLPLFRDGGLILEQVERLVGRDIAGKLAAHQDMAALGASTKVRQQLLDSPAFAEPPPPPIPSDVKRIVADYQGRQGQQGQAAQEAVAALAAQLRVDSPLLQRLDLTRYIGPFRRCWDIFVPEWSLQLDVPDITFRVTQDVNGDGTEEEIYSESHFDVRWNSGPIPDVTLYASQIALVAPSCVPVDVPCQEPAIVMAGFMPLRNLPAPEDPYHDAAGGYARRPNRPHPSGFYADPPPNPLAKSPFCDDLHLRGCNTRAGAQFYRLRYSFNGGPVVPFVGLTWQQFRWVGSPGHLEVLTVTPDSNGWYAILIPADGWMDPHLLLNLRSGFYQDGLYQVDMQLGDASKNPIHTIPQVGIRIDNSTPTAHLAVSWRVAGTGTWQSLASVCPVVERPPGAAVEFRVQVNASATHLRSISLTAGGCGAQSPVLTSAVPPTWEALTTPGGTFGLRHWHTDPDTDNSASHTHIFQLASSAPQGVYSFRLSAYGRAFNPAGWDNGDESAWNYDPAYYRYTHRHFQLAVVNL
ncbi:MAG: hypothetical protein HY332_13830 [Chloroflexi bacterium]|nr:hypothetical protein [Chloroflexota bacterium]